MGYSPEIDDAQIRSRTKYLIPTDNVLGRGSILFFSADFSAMSAGYNNG